jgi:hypothetical protein
MAWRDLFKPGFRSPVSPDLFAKAGQVTVALLVVGGKAGKGCFFESAGGKHAEQFLLESDAWKDALIKAKSTPAQVETIAVVINRTPCHSPWDVTAEGKMKQPGQAPLTTAKQKNDKYLGCSGRLTQELKAFYQCTPMSQVDFLLVCTGVYETSGPLENRQALGPTTQNDLRALAEAHWRLRALQVGGALTDRGKILANFIPVAESLVGKKPWKRPGT